MTITLTGQCQSGKNRILITRTGHRYPPKRFQMWRAQMVGQIRAQGAVLKYGTLTNPVILQVEYWPGDKRTRDVSGMLDALFQVIVHAGVLADDGLVWECIWRRRVLDRDNPRVILQLGELKMEGALPL